MRTLTTDATHRLIIIKQSLIIRLDWTGINCNNSNAQDFLILLCIITFSVSQELHKQQEQGYKKDYQCLLSQYQRLLLL